MNCNGCTYKEELSYAQDLLVLNENKIEQLSERINELRCDLERANFNSEQKERYLKLLIDTFTNLCSKPVIDHFNGKCKELDERGSDNAGQV